MRGGALRPRRKEQGLWLSVLMWSYASLRLYDKRLWEQVRCCQGLDSEGGARARSKSLRNPAPNAQVSLLLQGDPKWPKLLDANDALRLAWACRCYLDLLG